MVKRNFCEKCDIGGYDVEDRTVKFVSGGHGDKKVEPKRYKYLLTYSKGEVVSPETKLHQKLSLKISTSARVNQKIWK